MTPTLKVITEYCAIFVKDEPLESLAAEDMPLYARRMWGYLNAAIPLFTFPAEMQEYLLGTEEQPNLTPPTYDSTLYTVSEELTTDTVVSLGDEFVGYELFCCRIRQTDMFGNVSYAPAPNVTYDSEAGTITIAASVDSPVPVGTVYEIDFYTDGAFVHTLNAEEMKILGYCFQIVWQNRFNNDWLNLIPKIDDRSFSEQNRANKENADTNRLREMYVQLANEMRRYEQNLYHRQTFPTGNLRRF